MDPVKKFGSTGLYTLVALLVTSFVVLSENLINTDLKMIYTPREGDEPCFYRPKGTITGNNATIGGMAWEGVVEERIAMERRAKAKERISKLQIANHFPKTEQVPQNIQAKPRSNAARKLDYCRQKLKLKFLNQEEAKSLYRADRLNSYLKGCERAVCHFMDGKHRSPVCLRSFPGSGNTWLRGLLERASGICTGSVYFDRALQLQGFIGGKIESGAVLVYKAHRKLPSPGTKSLVFLIRNPYDALISEWTRQKTQGNHTGTVAAESFFGTQGDNSDWNTYVSKNSAVWMRMATTMIEQFTKEGKNILIIRYEDMKLNKVKEVKRVLDFLNISISDPEIERQLAEDFSVFKRKHSEETFDHFTSTQRGIVNEAILRVISVVQKHYPSDLNFKQYLRQKN